MMETAPIACPSCHAKLKVKRKHQGLTFRCPKCGEPVTVPEFLFPPEHMTGDSSQQSDMHSMSDAARESQKAETEPSAATPQSDPANDSHADGLRGPEARKNLKLGLETPVSEKEPTAEELAKQAESEEPSDSAEENESPQTKSQTESTAEPQAETASQTETTSDNDDIFKTMNQASDGGLDLSKMDDDDDDAFAKHGLGGHFEKKEEKQKIASSNTYHLAGEEVNAIELDMPEPEPEPTKEEIEAKAAEELAKAEAEEAARAEEEAKKKKLPNIKLSGFLKKKKKD